MDPQATWEELLRNYASGEIEEARRAADDLAVWLRHGGFPPHILEPITASDELHRVVALAVCRHVLGRGG